MNTAANGVVHIVDDDAAVRHACGFLLDAMGWAHQPWCNGQAFVQQVDMHQASVALIDLRMPLMGGEDVVAHLQQCHSSIGQIVLTGHGDVDSAVALLKLGVVDFLQKPVAAAALQAAIEQAWQQALKRQQRHGWRQCLLALTPKERQIAQLMLQGATNKDMAEALCVSQRTIEVHRAQVMGKFSCEHLAQWVQIYMQVADHPTQLV